MSEPVHPTAEREPVTHYGSAHADFTVAASDGPEPGASDEAVFVLLYSALEILMRRMGEERSMEVLGRLRALPGQD